MHDSEHAADAQYIENLRLHAQSCTMELENVSDSMLAKVIVGKSKDNAKLVHSCAEAKRGAKIAIGRY